MRVLFGRDTSFMQRDSRSHGPRALKVHSAQPSFRPTRLGGSILKCRWKRRKRTERARRGGRSFGWGETSVDNHRLIRRPSHGLQTERVGTRRNVMATCTLERSAAVILYCPPRGCLAQYSSISASKALQHLLSDLSTPESTA